MFDIEFAPLKSISLAELVRAEPAAIADLHEAAARQGAFYLGLDLDNDASRTIYQTDEAALLAIAKELFTSKPDDLLQYDIDQVGKHKLDGFKPLGRNSGITKDVSDGFEAFLVSRNHICNRSKMAADMQYPQIIDSNRDFIKLLMNKLHRIGEAILVALSLAMEKQPEDGFGKQHRPDATSTSALGVLRYPTLDKESFQLGHGAHTDVGSVTILFSTDYGLQFQDPTNHDWLYVEPRERWPVVNIGDSLRFMSELQLASCLHRVIPVPGKAIVDRYSWAYFMRPEFDATFVDASGMLQRSIDWHDSKYHAFRAPISEQENSSVLTGKTGYAGLWSPGA